MSIAKHFTLPLRVAVTVDGELVLSDAKDRDLLKMDWLGLGHDHAVMARLQELADAFNAAHADPPEITPGEERAIRAFTRKEYVRQLGDQAGLAALRGLSEGRVYNDAAAVGRAAAKAAAAYLEGRGYVDETD